jgi:hypothetical protein
MVSGFVICFCSPDIAEPPPQLAHAIASDTTTYASHRFFHDAARHITCRRVETPAGAITVSCTRDIDLIDDSSNHAYPVDTPEPGARLSGVENAPATLQTSRGLAGQLGGPHDDR